VAAVVAHAKKRSRSSLLPRRRLGIVVSVGPGTGVIVAEDPIH